MINEQQRRVANFALRLPDDVLGRIRARAAAHRRSMNSEIVHVLESVLELKSPAGAATPPGHEHAHTTEGKGND